MESSLNTKLKVHSFESLGTLDGPGLRYIIFLQGCPLKCKYCHNRDTWDFKSSGTEYTIQELIHKIQRFETYIKASRGGVTVSGGEPLLQAKNVTLLFKELHNLGIHTTLDTSGALPLTDEIKELLNHTDLVLLDIKHIDDKKSIDLTGVSNKNELNFARYLSDNNINMWIRQVLLPRYTDDENDLKNLKEFISSLKTVQKVEILPYHDYGKFKWEELGTKYELDDLKPPSEEEINKAKKILGI